MTGGIPASALRSDDPAVRSIEPTKLEAVRGQIARGEYVELPGGLGRAYLKLLAHSKSNVVEGSTMKAMEAAGLPLLPIHTVSYAVQRAARTMAEACFEDETCAKPFGTLAAWLDEDDDILFGCSLLYQDVRNRLDPYRTDDVPRDVADFLADALVKKNAMGLRSFGVATLASWLLSGAVQLSSSPTAASSTSPSTSDSNESETPETDQ